MKKNIFKTLRNVVSGNKSDEKKELILLQEANSRLEEENKLLLEKNKDLRDILLEIREEKVIYYFGVYREANSLCEKIKTLHKIEHKTKAEKQEIVKLTHAYTRRADKIKNSNLMMGLLKSEHLVGFVFNMLKEKGENELLFELKKERKRTQSQTWISINKL